MELSIVIPAYNEEENVEPLIGEINASSLRSIKATKSSSSTTAAKTGLCQLRQLHAHQPLLQSRSGSRRNFGQTAALAVLAPRRR
jgi:hypothetical protein